MKLTAYERFSYKQFRQRGKRYVHKNLELGRWLEKGHVGILPEAYIAKVYMTIIIMFFSILIFGYLFIFGIYPSMISGLESKDGLILDLIIPFIFYLSPFVVPLVYYVLMTSSLPKSKAGERKRDIEAKMPYALNFLAAMAATNATPEHLFRSLAGRKEIYGEICDEANWIYRDTKALGIDIIKAIKMGIKRSPSHKLAEFLQGVVNSLTSGRPLKNYLGGAANKYMREARKEQEMFIETLAFLAESYVVVGVAFPIFFMVILVIMYWVSGSGMAVTDSMLYAVVFGGLPIINGVYIFIVWLMTPEV